MRVYNTLVPYDEIERDDIQYTYCHQYNHISRYKGLRQVIHQGLSPERYIALETSNSTSSLADSYYYTVPSRCTNRLDIIAKEQLGSASYAWVLAYLNNIVDGFTVAEGTILRIPNNISLLFNEGEILAPVKITSLNLSSE